MGNNWKVSKDVSWLHFMLGIVSDGRKFETENWKFENSWKMSQKFFRRVNNRSTQNQPKVNIRIHSNVDFRAGFSWETILDDVTKSVKFE